MPILFEGAEHWLLRLPPETRVAVLLISALAVAFHVRFGMRTAQQGPAILTTLGILATFTSLAMGLAAFDPSDVKASVPALIAGLRTAFWASVAGVFWSVTLKLRVLLTGSGAVPGHAMARLDHRVQELISTLAPLTCLPDRLDRLHGDMVERLDALRVSQDRSLAAIAESGSKALVQALEEVVRDFNTALGEQFGANFARLHEAVTALITWQERYRLQIEDGQAALAVASARLQQIANRTEKLVDEAQAFADAAEDLAEVIAALREVLPVLVENTATLRGILQDASSTLPGLRGDWNAMAQAMASSMSEASRALSEAGRNAARDLEAANGELAKSATELSLAIGAQSRALEKEIEASLEASLTTLARQLGALSEKFVSDYEPLTRELQRMMKALRAGAA